MEYTRVKIFAGEENLEIISAVLMDKGVTGIELQEPGTYKELLNKQNSYDWDYVDSSLQELEELQPSLIFYMEDNAAGIELLDDILQEIRVFDIEKVEISCADDEDWKHKWKEYFKPAHITEKIVVKPSWEPYAIQPGESVIEIDPGMAFGTGTHPTTTLCIKLLEEWVSSRRSKILDVGCGSGILSVAAALMGADEVLGVDIDPMAVEVSEKNLKLNHMGGKVRVIVGDLTQGLDFKADIIVANLMADLIIRLSEHASKHLNPGGIFIASGILIEKKQEVASVMEAAGFNILNTPEEGEWCAIAAALK
ncbi:50S ribosomal protein L11 methyltransferase [Bacillota bacterium]